MRYPLNQMEFEKKYGTEDACRELIKQLKWPEGFVCSNCGGNTYWVQTRGRYTCRGCRYQNYLLSGTLFYRSSKSLMTWFRAIWWVVGQKNGVSALGLQRIMGLGSYRTAWAWLHKFRRLMVIPGRELLSGEVEVDETFIGGHHEGKRGRGALGKILVAVAVELSGKKVGRIRLNIIPDASSESLTKFITNNVEKGSTIITDGWPSYSQVTKKGYSHRIQKQSASVGDDPLPHIHMTASLLKRWLLGTHHGATKPSYLAYYLDEYTFRFNRRKSKSRGLLFMRILEQAVLQGPTYYKKIISQLEEA